MKDWFSITPREKIERWENVLRVLKGLTPHQRAHHWDMESWGYNTHCGTVACAAGHCGLDPWFRRRGFKLNVNHPSMTSHAATDFFWLTWLLWHFRQCPHSSNCSPGDCRRQAAH
jgi:hypothetical protein